MTVQQLIDQLNQVQDKSKIIEVLVEYGRGETMYSYNLSVDEQDCFVQLSGEEDM